MATITIGLATSHSPQLSTPPEQWDLRVTADRANKHLAFRGELFDYETLARARTPGFASEVGVDAWRERSARCREAILTLADRLKSAAVDTAVIIGNDQRELFLDDVLPAVTVFWGREIPNIPATAEERARMGPGIAVAEEGHCPPEGARYPGSPDLGRHVIRALIAEGFDVAQSARLPRDGNPDHGIPHAFGFVYRQLMADAPPPTVPVIVNANVPPNSPSAGRLLALGHALGRAIRSWDGASRVALVASGGLSHFVIDEEIDRRVISAMEQGDEAALTGIPENQFQAGTGEIKNWLPVVGAMREAGRSFHLVDYVPCYRSEAGTGTAMGFAYWE